MSRSSVAGTWGAVAGSLRFFADRFGVPRAAIEGTTISYDLVRRYARRGPAEFEVTGPRKHQHIVLSQRLHYFGFELDMVEEKLEGDAAPELVPALREGLARALLAGETTHPSQGRVRRAVTEAAELWRRSGGTLAALAPEAIRTELLGQLDGVTSWASFVRTPIEIDPAARVPDGERQRLLALPGKVRLLGDTVPIHYEVTPAGGVARLHLREGQVRRIREDDLPELDRPIRFAVLRGTMPAVEADTLEGVLQALGEISRQERRSRFKPPRHRRRRG